MNRKLTPEEHALVFPPPPPPPIPAPPGPPQMIVSLMGGVGNQLFQYAFGISVAKKRRIDVGFTQYRCKNDAWRPGGYQLNMFVDDIKLVPREYEIEPFFMDSDRGGVKHTFAFQEEVYAHQVGAYVGYWQTEKYFDEPLVRDKIRFRYPLGEQSLKVAEQIEKAGKGSTFLHVRRGADYKRSNHHLLQPLSYYQEVIKRVYENHENPKFFVFSDEFGWARKNFIGDDFVFVDHIEPDTAAIHEDMHLMSLCHNGAIANSSFSWWAAWLGDTKSGTIYAPNTWHGAGVNVDISDVVPDRWTKITCGS